MGGDVLWSQVMMEDVAESSPNLALGSPHWTSPPLSGRNFLRMVMFSGGPDSPYARGMRGQITLSQVSPRDQLWGSEGASDGVEEGVGWGLDEAWIGLR